MPGGGTAHSGLGLPVSIVNHGNAPTCPQANLSETSSQLRFLSLDMSRLLTKFNQHRIERLTMYI